jgi:Fe-S oxidoreductase
LIGRVTYHDPCYLGRYNEVYDAPRRVLSALGVELVEMPRNRARSYCCGAGGGRIWMEDTEKIQERPAENRIREAAGLPDVPTFVVACPKDIAMFRDAVKTTGQENKLHVKDLAELVCEAVTPE